MPEAVPQLKYLAWGYFPEIGYLDVMDELFTGEEVKGQFTGSKIDTITNFTAGWIVMVDKLDFVSNKEDLNFSSATDIL